MANVEKFFTAQGRFLKLLNEMGTADPHSR